MKLGDLHASSPKLSLRREPTGTVSKIDRHEPVHITRSPRLDPNEDNPLNQTIEKIQQIGSALQETQESIRSLDLYEAQRKLEALSPRIGNLIDTLNKLRMAGWDGPKGLGNPWAESVVPTALNLIENYEAQKQLIVEAEGDVYEDAWADALSQIYAFVHKPAAHIPDDPQCKGCWDSRGVDIFYSTSKPTGNPKTDLVDAPTVAQRKAGVSGRVVLIPQNAKMLQVKSSLDGAVEHVHKWHQLRAKSRKNDFKPVVVGNPPKDLSLEMMAQIEEKGYYLPPEQEKRSARYLEEFQTLMAAMDDINAGKRDPLSIKELNAIKHKSVERVDRDLPSQEESPEEKKLRAKREEEARRAQKLEAQKQKQAFLKNLDVIDAQLNQLYQTASNFMSKGRQGDPKTIQANVDQLLKDFWDQQEQMMGRLNQPEAEMVNTKNQAFKELAFKIKEKLQGRRRVTATGTSQDLHCYTPRRVGGKPLADKTGKLICKYRDETGKFCNNDAKHKSHINEPHSYQPFKLGKKTLCKTCGLTKAMCPKRQSAECVTAESIQRIADCLD